MRGGRGQRGRMTRARSDIFDWSANALHVRAGRFRRSRDVGVDPLRRVRGREGKLAGEHLVERDAERVEVASRVDGAVDPARLLWRHVGQRARDDLGRALSLSRDPRGDAESRQPGLAGTNIYEDVLRLDVLVHDALPVQLAERFGDADPDSQEDPQLPGASDQPREDLSTRVFEQQRVAAVLPHQRQRTGCPRGVQNVPQLVRVLEARERLRPFAEATLHQEAGRPIAMDARKDVLIVFPPCLRSRGDCQRGQPWLTHAGNITPRTGRIAKAPARIFSGKRSKGGFMPGGKALSEVLAGMLVAAAPALSAERTFEIASEHLDCRYSTATPA